MKITKKREAELNELYYKILKEIEAGFKEGKYTEEEKQVLVEKTTLDKTKNKKLKTWKDDFENERKKNLQMIKETYSFLKDYFKFVINNENYYLDGLEITYIKKINATLLMNKEKFKSKNRIATGVNGSKIKSQTKDHKNW